MLFQDSERLSSGNVFPELQKKVLTEKGIIKALQGMVEHRYNAVQLYPNAKHYAQNIEVITRLRVELRDADAQLNYKTAVKICLRVENPMLYLAPRTTVKIFTSYKEKLDFLMDACRVILNYQKQFS